MPSAARAGIKLDATIRQAFVYQTDGTVQGVGGTCVHVREPPFNAVGDGIVDDTAAVQAAMDFCMAPANINPNTGGPKFALCLCAGTYRLTNKVVAPPGFGFQMFGEGFYQSVLKLTSGTPDAVLDMGGASAAWIRNLCVTAAAPALPERLVYLHASPGIATRNILERLYCNGEFVEGIRLQKLGDTVQCDQTCLRDVTILGSRNRASPDAPLADKWRVGLAVGGGAYGNGLAHVAYDLRVGSCQTGVLVNATQMQILGGIVQTCDVDFASGGSGYFTVEGMRSEGSIRLLDAPLAGGSTNPITAVLRSCAFQGPTAVPDPLSDSANGTTGIATAVSATTLDDATATWTVDEWVGCYVIARGRSDRPVDGLWFNWPFAAITGNTGTQLQFAGWEIAQPHTEEFVVMRPATGGTATTLVDMNRTYEPGAYEGQWIWFMTGLDIGGRRQVISNTAHEFTFDAVPFAPGPDTVYAVTTLPADGSWVRWERPGSFELHDVLLYGSNIRRVLGRPPQISVNGDKRGALATLTKLSVTGAESGEAVVTTGMVQVVRNGYQQLDDSGVTGVDFVPPPETAESTLDTIGGYGLRLALTGGTGTLPNEYDAGVRHGALSGEVELVGSVRRTGGARATFLEVKTSVPILATDPPLHVTTPGITLTLPIADAAGAGVEIEIRATDFTGLVSGSPVTFAAPDGNTVNGAGSAPFAADWKTVVARSDGATKWVLS